MRIGRIRAGGDRRNPDGAFGERVGCLRCRDGSAFGSFAEARRNTGRILSDMRHAGSRDAPPDLAEVERNHTVVNRIRRTGHTEQTRRSRVRFHQRDMLGRAAGHPQIGDRLLIDRPEAGGRPIFRRHVGKRRAVGDRQGAGGRTEELDTRSDHAGCAELLGERQCHVGHGDAVRERTLETDTDEFRLREDVRLAQHDRFDLDAPDTPPQHAQRIHHRGVRVARRW